MSDEAERLFERALALEPGARRAFVSEACREDPRLGEELISLLEQARPADQFFERLTDAVFAASFSPDGSAPMTPPEDELQVGEVIGRYEIRGYLGRGGVGTVYRAHDSSLDRDVALKFLPAHPGMGPNADERLVLEARLAAALEHPNVCGLHEIGETADGRRFIAMACYEGETLKERLRRGPLAPDEAVEIAVQIARGLAAAHARGIIHRDVKPGNVMLGSDRVVRLLDFGVATMTTASLAGGGMTPGTVAYMSPEQARGDALDPRTDLWSLGVVLYEMLAGGRPFQGPNVAALLEAVRGQDPEPIAKRRPGVTDSLARIVDRLLQKDPTARYRDAGELLAEFDRALPSAAATPKTKARPRAGLLAAGGILVVALTALAVVSWWRRDSGSLVDGAGGRRAEPSIAVLPLDNLGSDTTDRVLAAGITEGLITTLARAAAVRVIGSTSSSRFRGREIGVRRIADSLGVSNILEGTVQRIGSQLRIGIRLVAGRDGATRWSQSYDREFKDVLAVQDEIVQAVAGELALRFDRDRQLRRHQTRDLAAYELYLRGWDPLLARTESGVWKAEDYFRRAIVADSMYAAAYAGLALVYLRRVRTTRDPGMPPPDLLAVAKATARKAVALDDSLPEAHYALGRVLEATLEFREAEQAIQRAIGLDPTRSVYRRALGYLAGWVGGAERELAEAKASLESDPLDPYAIVAFAGGLFAIGRYDDALVQLDRVSAVKPPLQGAAFVAAQCYARQGRLPQTIATLRPLADAGDPMFRGMLGHMLARAGQRDEANKVLADLHARRERTGGGAFQVAMVYAGLGDFDLAFAWLDRSIDDLSIGSVINGPTFEDLHRDPRFQRLRRRLGLEDSVKAH
jgi:serine/threonine-protein kinase